MMSLNLLSHPKSGENAILITLGHDLTVDEWIFRNIPCVLLYKDGFMDIYPIQEYTAYELTMLQRDQSYKSPWVPVRYGNFLEMQKCMYEILHEGLCAVCAKPPDLSVHDCTGATVGSESL